MKSKSGKEIIIGSVDNFTCFNNDEYEGFKLDWDSTIGFGQMTFYKDKNNLEANWCVDTECMSDNNDKEFIKLVLDKFIESLNVTE